MSCSGDNGDRSLVKGCKSERQWQVSPVPCAREVVWAIPPASRPGNLLHRRYHHHAWPGTPDILHAACNMPPYQPLWPLGYRTTVPVPGKPQRRGRVLSIPKQEQFWRCCDGLHHQQNGAFYCCQNEARKRPNYPAALSTGGSGTEALPMAAAGTVAAVCCHQRLCHLWGPRCITQKRHMQLDALSLTASVMINVTCATAWKRTAWVSARAPKRTQRRRKAVLSFYLAAPN